MKYKIVRKLLTGCDKQFQEYQKCSSYLAFFLISYLNTERPLRDVGFPRYQQNSLRYIKFSQKKNQIVFLNTSGTKHPSKAIQRCSGHHPESRAVHPVSILFLISYSDLTKIRLLELHNLNSSI